MTFATKLIAGSAVLASATAVFAHEVHGLAGAHWHATDAAGFIALALVVALAMWFGGRK